MKYNSLDKKAITIMRINALITLIVITAVFVFFKILNIEMSKEVSLTVYIIWGVIIFISLLDVLIFPNIRYQRYKYYISDEIIDVKRGLLVITRTIVPIERVQKIELTSGPIDRYFGLSTVVIYTAAGTALIKFLKTEEAQNITDKLNNIIKEKINETE